MPERRLSERSETQQLPAAARRIANGPCSQSEPAAELTLLPARARARGSRSEPSLEHESRTVQRSCAEAARSRSLRQPGVGPSSGRGSHRSVSEAHEVSGAIEQSVSVWNAVPDRGLSGCDRREATERGRTAARSEQFWPASMPRACLSPRLWTMGPRHALAASAADAALAHARDASQLCRRRTRS